MSGKLAAVVGWPVSHSLSPKLHSYWLAEHKLDGAYVALPVEASDFGRVVATLPVMGFSGVSVTVPHKEAAYAISETLDEDARATGAVNTLLFQHGRVHGKNTDVAGFANALAETLGSDAARKGPVVVLGAGGASRAILLALQHLRAPEIWLLNRTQFKADALAKLFPKANIQTLPWGAWADALGGAGLLINATSLGLRGREPLDMPLEALPKSAAVADIVYNPLETALLKNAKARGHATMGGLGMLLHQAVLQFEGFFGVKPKVTPELRAHLEQALPRD
jgi:shikimate dehydrogenase